MRKALALMLIGGLLAAGVSTTFAMENEQTGGSARRAAIVVATDIGTTAGGSNSTWNQHTEHERGIK